VGEQPTVDVLEPFVASLVDGDIAGGHAVIARLEVEGVASVDLYSLLFAPAMAIEDAMCSCTTEISPDSHSAARIRRSTIGPPRSKARSRRATWCGWSCSTAPATPTSS
jgi:hypothetical protein